jgi:hypothetical protein
MTECSVCLVSNENPDKNETTICGHSFHKNCLSNWLNLCPKKSCPICRETQPNHEGELITFWDNINWKIKTYQYGNIEKQFYENGKLKYEFILKVDNPNIIIRSKIYSYDGTGSFTHLDFIEDEIKLLREGGELDIPSRLNVINYILENEDIRDGQIHNIINNYIPDNILPGNIFEPMEEIN